MGYYCPIKLSPIHSPVASSICSPALPAISADLKIPPGSILENMSLSIFVLAYALGVSFFGGLLAISLLLIFLVATDMGTFVRAVWKIGHSTDIQFLVSE